MNPATDVPLGAPEPAGRTGHRPTCARSTPRTSSCRAPRCAGGPQQASLPRTCLLRNSPKVTYTYTNEAGEAVRSYTFERAPQVPVQLLTPARSSPSKARRATTRSSTASTRTATSCPTGRYTLTIDAASVAPSSVNAAADLGVHAGHPGARHLQPGGDRRGRRARRVLRRHRQLAAGRHRFLRVCRPRVATTTRRRPWARTARPTARTPSTTRSSLDGPHRPRGLLGSGDRLPVRVGLG